MSRLALRNLGLFHQRGSAVVEFAIVLPLLLLLTLGTAEFGHAFYRYNTLTKAVRDGARYLAAHARLGDTNVIVLGRNGPEGVPLTLATQNVTVFGNAYGTGTAVLDGLSVGDINVTVADSEHISVSATYTYSPIFSMVPGFGLGSDISTALTLQASVIMRAL